MKKPNVLFIVTDDQRYDTIAALGNCQIITPNLDALVEGGTSFTNAYIPGGLHAAVCMPSRAMINTGRNLFGIEGNGESIPESHVLLGEHLRKCGYHSFGTGKWHNGPPAFTRSFDEGENAFFSGMWDHWNVPTCRLDPTGIYDNVINFTANFYQSKDIIQVHCDEFHPGVHSSELLADTTIKFIEEYKEEKPFFCYTAFLAPHDPRTMPDEYRAMYDGSAITLPANVMAEYPMEFAEKRVRDETLAPYPRTEARMREELCDYYAMITHLDHQIGRIIDALKRTDQWENTIIILCGDNGLAIGSHALMGKQNHFEHSVKVPLLFAGPSIPAGRRVEANVFLSDIFATVCDVLEISIPSSVQGNSFCSCFTDSKQHRETLYYAYGDTIRSIRDGEWKLSEYLGETGKLSTLLYHINSDPMELHNLHQEDSPISRKLRHALHTLSITEGDTDRPESTRFWQRYDRARVQRD